jgi:hypothetical protein
MLGGQVVEQPILERAERVLRYHEVIEARRNRAERAAVQARPTENEDDR